MNSSRARAVFLEGELSSSHDGRRDSILKLAMWEVDVRGAITAWRNPPMTSRCPTR